jgi:hypothetical protein
MFRAVRIGGATLCSLPILKRCKDDIDKPKALPITAKLTAAQGACQLARSVGAASQAIEIDNLIQPHCVSICVLRATRDAKSARREQNRPATGRELRRVSRFKLFTQRSFRIVKVSTRGFTMFVLRSHQVSMIPLNLMQGGDTKLRGSQTCLG